MLKIVTTTLALLLCVTTSVFATEIVYVQGDMNALVEAFENKVERIGDYDLPATLSSIKKYVKDKTLLEFSLPKKWLNDVRLTEQTKALHSVLQSMKADDVVFVARTQDMLTEDFSSEKLKMPADVLHHYVKEWPIDLVEGIKYLYEEPINRRLSSVSKAQFLKALNSKKVPTWGIVGVKSPYFSIQELRINIRDIEAEYGLWVFNGKKTMGGALSDLRSLASDTEDLGLFGAMVRDTDALSTNDGITAVLRYGRWSDGAKNLIQQKGFQLTTPVYVYTVKNPSEAVKKFLKLVAKN